MYDHIARIIIVATASLALWGPGTGSAMAQGKAPAPTATPPGTRPSTAQQTQAAYEKARRLFRQSRYKPAIRAFEEVKDLQYHPILDYGIAKCHEGLLDYKSAIYYLHKYVRNYTRHKMSKRHPTLADAKVKIGVLKKRLKAMKTAPPTGTAPMNPVTPPPAPGETPVRVRATAITKPAGTEAFPGPYPFAPRVFSGVNPPKPSWVRRSIILYFGLGGGAFAREDAGTLGEHLSANGGITMGLLWRINPYVAIGPTAYISGAINRHPYDVADLGYLETDNTRLLYAPILLETRAILPVSRVDLWIAFGIGYTHISIDYEVGNSETEVSIPSLGLRGTMGLDIFLSESFTLGLVLSFTGTVPGHICVQDEKCRKPINRDKPGLLWHLGMTFNWHLPTSSIPKVKARQR